MKFALLAAAAALYSGAAFATPWNVCGDVETWPGLEWPVANPAADGWDVEALTDAKAQFEMMQSASVVVVHKGRLIADWGDSAERFTVQSVRKGLLSSLVGALVDDGKLSLDMTLADLGIDDSDPPISEDDKQATLRDLLQARSGIYHSALYEAGGWKSLRPLYEEDKRTAPERHRPGAVWFYNNWDFNALGTIVEKASGQPIGDFFARIIARPLAMQDFRASDVEYTTKADMSEQRFKNVSDHRAYMFDISTRDLARYGVLYLGCGKWKSREILPRQWVLDSLDGIDTDQGRPAQLPETGFGDYGYLWQIDRPGVRRYADFLTREPAYFATGNRGHMLAVFPYLDLVIAHQVGTRGGVSAEAQIKRATKGSPEVTDEEMTALIKAIIAAHPEAATAYEPE
jgi:CubicO group peptidase (beta-lactamase class C family)